MKEVCLGTIGSGPIVHHILDNVKLVEGVSLKAVYSRTIERARQLADEYGCTVSEEGDYVIYYEAESGRVANLNSTNSLSDPVRDGYTFAGWGSSSTATKPSYTSENVADAEGGRRLYAIWIEEELN